MNGWINQWMDLSISQTINQSIRRLETQSTTHLNAWNKVQCYLSMKSLEKEKVAAIRKGSFQQLWIKWVLFCFCPLFKYAINTCCKSLQKASNFHSMSHGYHSLSKAIPIAEIITQPLWPGSPPGINLHQQSFASLACWLLKLSLHCGGNTLPWLAIHFHISFGKNQIPDFKFPLLPPCTTCKMTIWSTVKHH